MKTYTILPLKWEYEKHGLKVAYTSDGIYHMQYDGDVYCVHKLFDNFTKCFNTEGEAIEYVTSRHIVHLENYLKIKI